MEDHETLLKSVVSSTAKLGLACSKNSANIIYILCLLIHPIQG